MRFDLMATAALRPPRATVEALSEASDNLASCVTLIYKDGTPLLPPRWSMVLTEGAIVNDQADPKRPQRTVLKSYIAQTVAELHDKAVTYLPSNHYPGDASNAHPTGEQHAATARDFAGRLAELLAG